MKRAVITVWALILCISFGMAQSLQQADEVQRRMEEPDVYVAGRIGSNAVLWKNGVAKPLTALTAEEDFATTTSVYVAGDDVYVAGCVGAIYDGNGMQAISLWKNGALQYIESEAHWDAGTSVYVSGSDVYVTAYTGLWKNGVAQNSYGVASSVFVSGNDVYVAGRERPVAILWKNGTAQNLTDGSREASAESVFVAGNDAYVAGYEKNARGDSIAIVWKNGAAQNLSDGTRSAAAYAVFVAGGNTYVAGSERNAQGKSVAKVWKNGEAQNLSDGTKNGVACSVYVLGNSVYAAGYEGGRAVVWKNGAAQFLTDGKIDAGAYAVFIMPDEAQRSQMAEEQRLQEQELLYQNAIASAQQNLDRKQYEQARQDFTTALNLKPEEAAAINPKIEEIDRKLNEPATLNMYRKRTLLGGILPVRYDVTLDNAVVGRTNNNWKTTATVTSFGAKTLLADIDGRKAEVQINITPGGVYYVQCDLETTEVDTGKKDKNGKAIKDYIYTPILKLVEENLGASEFKAIK